MQQNYNKKRKYNRLKASLLMLLMTLFAVPAMAQNVYMHTGTQTVPGTGSLSFYDSGGPSSPDYWWEKWYSHNENATLVFKNGTSPILVTFNQFTAYDGDTGANIGQYSLRINDDHLYVYEGEGENASKLIVDLTGTIDESFSIMANGPITFKFVSNGSYREEGWAASVSSAATYVVQQPIIIKDECEDAVVLYPMAYNATIYYTTNGSTPTASSTEYDGAPFNIDLSSNVTVKAIAVVEDQANSAVASRTFTSADQRPTPGVPTISINGNMVHITPAAVPAGLNETYNVRYTVDGTEPSANNGTLITSPWNAFEWQTPNTTFKAVTVAVNCPDRVSAVVTETFGNVKVPTPVITFNANGTATISCSLTGATIYYTIDGSTPTTSSTLNGLTSVTTAALTPGTTVKAIAHYASSGYVDSDVASNIYVPSGGSTVSGGVVLLDDREDHSWSYYSDDDQPIHRLNPADVKITYTGYGNNTMTTTNTAATGLTNSDFNANVASNQVAVNHDAPENQFIYLKTLEAANADGSGNYPYTMIPNPFQVRPTYSSRSEGDGEIPRATNTLLNQNFDGTGFTIYDNTYNSGAWYTYNAGNGNNWELYQNSSYAHSGDYNMCYAYNSSNAANCYLVSEPFSVSASMTQLSVSMYERVMLSNYAETFEVFFVKASEVTTLAAVASATHYSAISSASYTNESYAQVSGSLASSAVSALAGQSVRVVVHCTSAADQYRLYIDDITVTETTSGGGGGGSTIECNTETFSGVTATAYNSGTINLPTGWESGRSNTNNAYAPRVCNYNNGNIIGNYDGNYLIMSARQGTSYYNWAIAPQYEDITSISFRFRFSSSSYGQLEVGYLVGTSLYTLQTISTSNTYSNGWNQFTLSSSDVATINNNDGQLVFMFSSTRNNNTWYHVAIDDVEICYTVPVSTYNVNIASGITGGTVTASPTTAAEGATVTLTATPSGSNELSSISVTGNTSGNIISVNGSGSTYTFTMPAEDVTVNATFVAPQIQSNYRGFYAWRVKSLSSGLTIQRANGTSVGVGGYIDAEEEIKFVTDNEEGNEVEFEALWAQAWVTTSTSTAGLNPNVSYERNFMVLSGNPGSTSSTTQWPTSSSTTYTDGANLPIYQYSGNYLYSLTQQIYTPAQIGSAGTINQLAFNVRTSQNSNRTLLIYLSAKPSDYNTIPQTTNSNNQTVYRTIPIDVSSDLVYSGTVNFNTTGWKTITLDTPFEYDGTSNLVVTVMDNTNSARSMVFYTYSSGGTRAAYFSNGSAVDLGQYYYYVDGTSTYNNQIRFEKAISNLAGINVPLTITTYNPDGTGGSTSVTLSDAINCGADLKIENIKMNSISILSANGQNLSIGRGVTPSTSGGLCASYVKGLNTNATSPNYKIRLESGVFDIVSMIDGYTGNESSLTISGTPKVSLVLGNDYDRASEKYTNGSMTISEKLDVKTAVSVGRSVTIGSASMISEETFKIWVKSGKIGSDHDMDGFDANFTETLYMSSHGLATNAGYRKLFIEGGEISGVAGGMDACYSSTTTHGTNKSVTIRMTNGHIRSAIYGGAAQVPAGGDKEIIVTGGVVTGWIGAGCNGTADYDGQTYGEGFIYFGGDAISGGNGSSNLTNGVQGGVVFGAGAGRATSTTTGEMTFGTNVVIADDCNVEHNVYGGGNYGYAVDHSNVYVLGGIVQGNVFGGANQKQGPVVNITMENGTVSGNIYGGSNALGTISGLATINVSGGTVSNVFGGGYGSATDMTAGTKVNISDGTINNNVYGGGEEGTVSAGGTEVNVSGGTMKDVYGAGKGATNQPALVTGQTKVNISGGTIANVYGGGEAGNITNGTNLASIVTVSSGTISGDVFGGGKMGTTTGAVTTTVSGGNIRGNVFGGAEGEQKKVFVTGLRTVNMTGGHVYGNVYGGSRNANDGNDLNLSHNSFGTSTETGTISVTNISGGIIDQNVYAAGYYGNTFGSVYAFIGKNAIENAPHKSPTTGVTYSVKTLSILGTIWAGGDWGTFSGSFGGPTISGNSNIYVDGTSYETTTTQTSNAQYMNIGGSILGCGTSCDAGKAERTIMIRNYGTANSSSSKDEPYTEATRSLLSIQRAKLLVFDNAHLNLNGQGMVNSLGTTEKYGIYEIANVLTTTPPVVTEDLNYGVRLVNGSSIFLNSPASQIANFISASCSNIYTADVTTDYTPLTPSDLGSIDNKVRVNGGNYVEVKYGNKFGMLKGYAHMMVSSAETDATCAYARPRWETNAPFIMNDNSYDNRDDGGWVSYTDSKNKFDLAGNNPVNPGVQMSYENHTHATKNGEEYFRIWRDGGNEHYREGVFNAHATGTTTFKTTDVTITLPPLRDRSYVYRFETVGDGTNTSIAYGADIMAYDAARATGTGDDWISYTTTGQQSGQTQADVQTLINEGILANPDVNFGLVVLPTAGLGLTGDTYLISQNSDNNLALATTQFTNRDFTKDDQVTFRLTYYDKLSSNMTWDPMTIVLVQVDPQHPDVVLDRVTISLAVNTNTTITQEFTTTLYAVMQGKGSTSDTYTAKVTLPNFTVVSGQESTFTVNSVAFTHQDGTSTSSPLGVLVSQGDGYDLTRFAVTYGAAMNYDNTNGWASNTGQNHDANNTHDVELGTTGGRSEFAIDFTLHYNGHESITTTDTLGLLTFNLTFDYFVDENGVTQMNQPLNIQVYVIRRGEGTKFYLDGINGSNTYDGKHPDQAALSLSTIFNRLGYLAGDEIYIVNKVTIDKQTTWNGSAYDNVLIYRYDGGHELATSTGIIGNSENAAYLDELVYVTHSLVMTGITLDGHYNNGENQIQVGVDEHNDPVYAPFTPVTAAAPMIAVANGASVELNEGTVLRQNNNNSTDGGAVYVADGGTLMMNANAAITENKTAGNGGGVYMAGMLNVSDDIQIYNNKKGTAQNNVYLMGDEKVVTIGTGSTTDAYGALSASAKIGVTKSTSGEYTKVVHVDSEGDVDWLDTPMPRPNSIIFHDANIYQLERYDDITYLYWVGTWVTTVTWNPYYESREATGYTNYMTAAQLKDIQTPQQLAWVISMANGENGCTAQSGMVVEIQKDIDMDASIWVPIGTTAHPFNGTFEGNGHLIEGVHSSLVHNNMGVFGTANGIVKNTVFKVDFDANSTNMGTVAGTMTGGTISNVEAAGTLKGGSLTKNMGGLVGVSASGSTIHSSFAVNAMTGVATTVMGGLVGTNGGDLFNSYANTDMNVSEHIGGLVGDNNGHVENCYVVVGVNDFPLFAKTNSSTGIIKYCYADKAGTYIGTDENTTTPQPTLSGNYSAVVDRKTLGYMYGDNIVTAPGNGYVKTTHEYVGKHAILWDGLLSVLNQWVNDGHTSYTKWYRPITQNINGDLPVLAFSKANCMATVGNDKKFLDYSNDLDQLLETYGGQTANIFLYGNAVDVENVPGTNVNVFINEDAVLLQTDGADPFGNVTVGITFDNSCRNALDHFGNVLHYDWHMMSTPLSNAEFDAVYADSPIGYGESVNITSISGSYFPDDLITTDNPAVGGDIKWDFYSYYEPQYHWINFKRSANNHWHFDDINGGHPQIVYNEDDQKNGEFTPGKGYMMAINQDSYLCATGTLNKGGEKITLTAQEDMESVYNKGWNLVGNPYQAYLNLGAIGGDFYIYDADQNVFAPVTDGQSENECIPSLFIHPHQAFFMYTNGGDDGYETFEFDYSLLATATSQAGSYFRGDEGQVNYPLVNLFAENGRGNRDLAVIELLRPELGGASKVSGLRNTNFQIAASYEGQRYGILFTPEDAERVPVHFTTEEDGTYTLTWKTQNGEFTSLLLVDNMTGTITDMLRADHYTFDAKTEDYASRFYITYSVTGVDEYVDGDGTFAFFDGSQWIVEGQGCLTVVDMLGRTLHSERLVNERNHVNLSGVTAGVYLMRLSDGENTRVQKIVVK